MTRADDDALAAGYLSEIAHLLVEGAERGHEPEMPRKVLLAIAMVVRETFDVGLLVGRMTSVSDEGDGDDDQRHGLEHDARPQ